MTATRPAEPAAGPVRGDHPARTTPWLMLLIGLAPLLAASDSFSAGLALGLASLAVLCAGNVLLALAGRHIPRRLQPAAGLLLVAALVTAVDLLMQARWFELHGKVGLFVPLIVTQHLVMGQAMGQAEGFAVHRGLWPALRAGLGYGTGSALLLAGLGALRELLGPDILVAGLVPGALFLLAGLVALHRLWLDRRRPQ